MKEEAYIRKRKRKAFRESLAFYLCRIFPIKKNLISLCTFEGKGGFGCNPKYLAMELHRQHPEYQMVWLVNDESWDKQFPEYIRKVHNTLWSRAYWLTRSKVWIDNYRKPYGTVKRKGQYYLNVNHYTMGFKCTGLWRGEGFSKMAYLVSKNDSDMVDDFVIDSKWCEIISDKALVYDGTYLKTGAPRNDALYGDRSAYMKRFRDRHNLPEDAKVLMFAPTFREGAKDGVRSVFSEIWSVDFKRLLENFDKKFGGKWYLCVRVHPQLAPTFAEYKNPDIQDRLIDESQADDMHEILAAMDAYITDYSSAAMDAALCYMPVFIYADDIEEYINFRGNMMWNFSLDSLDHVTNNKDITPTLDVVLPFTVATNNEELERHIMAFDYEDYVAKVDDYKKETGIVFDGQGSAKLARVIEGKMK